MALSPPCGLGSGDAAVSSGGCWPGRAPCPGVPGTAASLGPGGCIASASPVPGDEGLRAAGRLPAALPGSQARRVRSAPGARSPIPDARSAFRGDSLRPRGCAGGRTRGPDGGAGAGRTRAPREMPSGARCRLYLRSRLTSAARVPRARAAPGDLARPLHPHSLIPLRYNPSPGPPRAGCSLRSLGQLGAERGGWPGTARTPAGGWTPPPLWPLDT